MRNILQINFFCVSFFHFKPSILFYRISSEITLIIVVFLCRWFEWDATESNGVHGWGLKSSKKVLNQLEDVGQQLALTFDDEGSVLAVGGEVGFIVHVISDKAICFRCMK